MKSLRVPALLLAALAFLPASRLLADAPKVGDKPSFKYKTTDGKEVSPATLAGHVVVLDFWATWCGPCMQMAPHMVELNKEYADKGLAIIGVSLDQDQGQMLAVAKDKGLTWPQIFDASTGHPSASDQWAVNAIPHCFILSPTGEILWAGHPAQMNEPLKEIIAKFPYEPKKPAAAPAPAAETPAPAIAKPAGPKVLPAVLDAKIAAAAKAKAAKHDVEAYELYKWVAFAAPGTEQSAAAQIQVDTYNANADFTAQYKKVIHEREASSTLWLAQNLEKTGKLAEARANYLTVIKDYADTPSAAEAKKDLDNMK